MLSFVTLYYCYASIKCPVTFVLVTVLLQLESLTRIIEEMLVLFCLILELKNSKVNHQCCARTFKGCKVGILLYIQKFTINFFLNM